MTLEQFADMLDRLGAKPSGWPMPERDAAQALLAASPEAAALLAEAQAIEDFVRANDPAAGISDADVTRLSNAVLSRIPAQPPSRQPGWRAALEALGQALGAGREWGPRFAYSTAAAAVLGLLAGGFIPASQVQPTSAVDLLSMSHTYLALNE